jgi:hypothetical protein
MICTWRNSESFVHYTSIDVQNVVFQSPARILILKVHALLHTVPLMLLTLWSLDGQGARRGSPERGRICEVLCGSHTFQKVAHRGLTGGEWVPKSTPGLGRG